MKYSMSADCELDYNLRERIYGVKIENNSKETKECVLFGVNKNSTLVNYGSDPEVRVDSTINGVNYHQIMSEIPQNKDFKLSKIRLFLTSPSEDALPNGLLKEFHEMTFLQRVCGATGQMAQTPIFIKDHYKDEQVQKSIIDIDFNYDLVITHQHEFALILPPMTKFNISFFFREREGYNRTVEIKKPSLVKRFWKRIKSIFKSKNK